MEKRKLKNPTEEKGRTVRKKYDEACKRVLSQKIILAWILKECVAEFDGMDVNEIAAKHIDDIAVASAALHQDEEDKTSRIHGVSDVDASAAEGTVTYDIRFHAYAPTVRDTIRLIINLEAQSRFHVGYPLTKRAVYYCGRMISAQYGTEFGRSHYERIKKVYSVWICVNVPDYRKNTITLYSLEENNLVGNVRENRSNYDLLTIVMICLGGAEDESGSDLLRLLNLLFSSEQGAEEKQRILKDEFDIQMAGNLEKEVSEMCNLSEGVWEKGMKRGIEQGMEQARKETAVRMYQEGCSMELIEKVTERTEEVIKQWLDGSSENSKSLSPD